MPKLELAKGPVILASAPSSSRPGDLVVPGLPMTEQDSSCFERQKWLRQDSQTSSNTNTQPARCVFSGVPTTTPSASWK